MSEVSRWSVRDIEQPKSLSPTNGLQITDGRLMRKTCTANDTRGIAMTVQSGMTGCPAYNALRAIYDQITACIGRSRPMEPCGASGRDGS